MTRSKITEEQVKDEDFMSEAEHDIEPHSLIDLTDTPTTYSGAEGQYLKATASGTEWATVSGVEVLTDLTDTPSTYDDGKYLKSTASGTEWDSGTQTLLDLTDTPSTYIGTLNQYLMSNGSRSTWATISGIGLVLADNGVPANDIGSPGDFYIDKDTETIYEKIQTISGSVIYSDNLSVSGTNAFSLSEYSTRYDDRAFDGTVGGYSTTSWNSGSEEQNYIGYYFPVAKAINKIRMASPTSSYNRTPVAFKLMASNSEPTNITQAEGGTLIYEVKMEGTFDYSEQKTSVTSHWAGEEWKAWEFTSNTTEYNYYWFLIWDKDETANRTAQYMVSEIEMMSIASPITYIEYWVQALSTTKELLELNDTPTTYSGTTDAMLVSTGSGIEFTYEGVWLGGSGAPSGASGNIGNYYIDEDTAIVYKKNRITEPAIDPITAKSIIIDIADNWGGGYHGIKEVNFKLDDSLITNIETTDFVAYSTSDYPAWQDAYPFDTSFGGSWMAANAEGPFRLVCVFNSNTDIDEITITNFQNSVTDRGVKNVKIYYSTNAITDTTYDAAIAGSTLLFDGQITQGVYDQVIDISDAMTNYTDTGWDQITLEAESVSFLDLSDTPTTYSGAEGQYLRATASGTEWATVSSGITDHGELTGLSDNDHPQYLLTSNFSTYSGTLQSQIDGKSTTGHTHDDRYYTESEIDTISGSLQSQISTTFIELTDTPSTYSGTSGAMLVSTGSGTEFTHEGVWLSDTGIPGSSLGEIGNYYLNETTNIVYKKNRDVFGSLYTAKSIILDIADNWGDGSYIEFRSIDFYNEGSLVAVTYPTDFTAYGTYYAATLEPDNIYDTSTSKIGSTNNNGWVHTGATNTRTTCVFNTPISFDSVIINNGHNGGGSTARGIKSVKIYTSSDSITSLVYNEAISNSLKIFDGEFDQHVASNVEDPQEIISGGSDTGWDVVINSTSNISFLDLTDTPTTYSGVEGQYLRATASGTEWATVSSGITDHGELNGLSDDDHPQYLTTINFSTYSGTLQTQIDGKSDTDHSHTLLNLTDTPSSYDADKYLRSTASGTEWGAIAGGVETLLELTDTPSTYSGTSGAILISTGSGTEFTQEGRWLSGEGAPPGSLGADTNMYLDILNDAVYYRIPSTILDEYNTNIALTGTASADSVYNGGDVRFVASKANDGDVSGTRWISDTGAPHWWQVEWAEVKYVSRIGFIANIAAAAEHFSEYYIEYWANGEWNESVHVTGYTDQKPTVTYHDIGENTDKLRIRTLSGNDRHGMYEFLAYGGVAIVGGWEEIGTFIDSTSFLDLTDTPSTYSGTEGMYLRSTGSATEWVTVASGIETLTGLTDTPSTYSGTSTAMLVSTGSGTDFTYEGRWYIDEGAPDELVGSYDSLYIDSDTNDVYSYVNNPAVSGTESPEDETVLLLHMEGSDGQNNFYDDGTGANCPHTMNVLNLVTTETEQKKFGTSSAYYITKHSHRLYTADASSDFNFGTGAFSIDFFVRFSTGSYVQYLFTIGYNLLSLRLANNVLYVYPLGISYSWAPDTSWHHLAFEADGSNNQYLYLDGLVVDSSSSGASLGGTDVISIGNSTGVGTYSLINGYIDEFRVVKGAQSGNGTTFPVPEAQYNAGYVAGSSGWEKIGSLAESSVVNVFLDLVDTPTTYSGSGGKYVTIKEDETGLEFTTAGDWTTVSSNYDASNAENIFINSTASGIVIALPDNPIIGHNVSFVDAVGNCGTNNVTVSGGSTKILGLSENFIIDYDYARFTLTYYDTTNGWVLGLVGHI